MTPNSSNPDPSFDTPPMVEIQLNIGDAVQIGNRILRVIDIEDGDAMFKIVSADADNPFGDDDLLDNSRWFDLPR